MWRELSLDNSAWRVGDGLRVRGPAEYDVCESRAHVGRGGVGERGREREITTTCKYVVFPASLAFVRCCECLVHWNRRREERMGSCAECVMLKAG